MELSLVGPLMRWLLLVAVLHQTGLANGHTFNAFTSVAYIKSMMRTDNKVAHLFRHNLNELFGYKADGMEYVAEQERMEMDVKDWLERRGIAASDQMPSEDELISVMAGNPLHAFQSIRRLTLDMHKIANGVDRANPHRKGHLYREFRDALDRALVEQNVTYSEDLIGSAKGLLRLQDIYHLQAVHLAKGLIRNIQTSCRLTVADCLLLGQVAKEVKRMDVYVEWTEQASNLCHEMENEKNDGDVKQNDCHKIVDELLMLAVKEHDERKAMRAPGYYLFPVEVRLSKASEQTARIYDQFDPRANAHLENNLCYVSGRLMSPEEESKLLCNYLVKADDPYVTLHRYKVEQQSVGFPHLVTIYDVITSEEADFIKQAATPALTRSTVVGKTNQADREFSEQRISATAWLKDTADEKLDKISKRIQAITGMSTAGVHAEQYQVVNYGIGGMYNAHYDYLYKKPEMDRRYNETGFMGNRIITFILYLSDVELGGATAFPNVKTAVRPKKGAAAMWFNINDKMDPDERSFHGGCPVLLGSKWIANKWILEGGQIFRHPCPANPAS